MQFLTCASIAGPDVTKFLATVKSTELFGSVSLLYATIVPIGKTPYNTFYPVLANFLFDSVQQQTWARVLFFSHLRLRAIFTSEVFTRPEFALLLFG